jgi:hypothetical protein
MWKMGRSMGLLAGSAPTMTAQYVLGKRPENILSHLIGNTTKLFQPKKNFDEDKLADGHINTWTVGLFGKGTIVLYILQLLSERPRLSLVPKPLK